MNINENYRFGPQGFSGRPKETPEGPGWVQGGPRELQEAQKLDFLCFFKENVEFWSLGRFEPKMLTTLQGSSAPG